MLAVENSHCLTILDQINRTDIFQNTCFLSVSERMVKNTDQGTASINVDPKSKQANLQELLTTRLKQTRVLKQYNVKITKSTINIKNISARHTIGNNKRILLTKIIILEIARELPSKETLIKEKPVSRFASQTT